MPSSISGRFLPGLRAFDCEEFDNGSSFLRADYSVRCEGDEYTRIKGLAALAIALFPVGIPLSQLLMLLSAREAIANGRHSRLERALAFLHSDFEPSIFWWEIAEQWKKLFLVGFAALIKPASVDQLVVSLMFALIFMLVVAICSP